MGDDGARHAPAATLFPAAAMLLSRTPLFPISSSAAAAAAAAPAVSAAAPDMSWLSNASFAAATAAAAAAAAAARQADDDDNEWTMSEQPAPPPLEQAPVPPPPPPPPPPPQLPSTAAEQVAGESSSESEEGDDKKRKRKGKERRRKEKERRAARKRARHEKRVQQLLVAPRMTAAALAALPARTAAKGVWTEEGHSEGGWFFEGHGDQNNVSFGSLYRADVPRYVRRARRCMGLAPRLALQFVPGKGLTVANLADTKSARAAPRYSKPQFALAQLRTDIKRLTLESVRKGAPRAAPAGPPGDFIALEPQKGGAAKEGEGETFEEYLYRKTGELNEATQRPDQSEKTWLEYIRLQDEFSKLGDHRAVGSLLEKKLMMYQRALECYPKSEELVLGYLSVCQAAWDSSKVSTLWEKILAHQGTEIAPRMTARLWREYIRFCLSSFTNFNMTLVRSTHVRAISLLSRLKAAIETAPDEQIEVGAAEIDEFLISLVYRLCSMELQAGYAERALGVFQAVTEFACLGPSPCRRSDFLRFWESEGPRVGNTGAQGWGEWLRCDEAERESRAAEDAKSSGDAERQRRQDQRERRRLIPDNPMTAVINSWKEPTENVAESFFRRLQKQLLQDPTLKSYATGPGPEVPAVDEEEDEEDIDEEGKSNAEDEKSAETVDKQVPPAEAEKAEPKPEAAPKEEPQGQTEGSDLEAWREDYGVWAREEVAADAQRWRPLRPLTEDARADIQDPECVTLADDVKDFLFTVVGRDQKRTLVHRFLQFVGVPVPRAWSTATQHHRDSVSTLEDLAGSPMFAELELESSRLRSAEAEGRAGPSTGPAALAWVWRSEWNEPESGRSLLGGRTGDVLPAGLLDFARHAADLCVAAFPEDPALACGRLLLEVRYAPDQAKVAARELLAKRRNDLRLWNCYAQAELALGHTREAARVYEAALAQGRTPSRRSGGAEDGGLRQLYRAYAQTALHNEPAGSTLALRVLTAAADFAAVPVATTVPGATALLAARRAYETATAREPADVDTAECHALFRYVTEGVSAAVAAYEPVLAHASAGTRAHEHALEHRARLLYWHAQLHPAAPALLRVACTSAAALYPANALFVTLHACAEQRAHMGFRLRAFFDSVLGPGADPALWLFAVRAEDAVLGSTVRVRALCERALLAPDAQPVAALWLYLVRRLVAAGDMRSAKQTYFRAVRHAPWCKHVWCEALREPALLGAMTRAELRQIAALVDEKEIRLRGPPPGADDAD
eukprot:TRINITY_DN1603_c1_g1_i1.p1 TRINITY_DN1603_c1_g1~~TRINITY_DN1603_c1_g1_i1.p1  ORF type:complete len:1250 (-),score=349.04 TRINITY_DN1603_c1_g1_i1:67-3816(-)